MSGDLTFLPWLRRGLAATIEAIDDGASQIDRAATLSPWVEVNGERATGSVSLRPVDHVRALDLSHVLRRYPAPGATDAETGYWPQVELAAPDLPWVVTPLGADDGDRSRLRPWLVLVCVPQAEALYEVGTDDQPGSLSVDAGILPDLTDAHLWAHVQSLVAASEVLGSLEQPGVVISRLLAPVDLQADTAYRAAVVRALIPAGDTTLGPAWTGAGEVVLDVFDTWTFRTGLATTFADMVTRLGPAPEGLGLDLGIAPVDITEQPAIDPWPDADRVVVDYAGPLIDSDLEPAGLEDEKGPWNAAVRELLDAGDHRVDLGPDDPDPVVAPPLYGAFATQATAVPEDKGWQRSLNLTVRHRMAAGLGADLVREHQERFMATAWDQVGEVLEALRVLGQTRLQAELGRTWKARIERLEDVDQLSFTRSAHAFVRTGGQPSRQMLADSRIPDASHSLALTRLSRPGSVADRTVRRAVRRDPERTEPEGPAGRGSWHRTARQVIGNPDTREALRFGRAPAPIGTVFTDRRHLDQIQMDERWPDPQADTWAVPPGRGDDTLAVTTVAADGRSQIRPMTHARARAEQRVSGLSAHLEALRWPYLDLPTRIRIGPTIDEALVWALMERSAELVMPGVGDVPDEVVRLVRANAQFVAAFLAGANHEMTRELLWREYPAQVGHTTFHRFWDRPVGDRDVEDMHLWPAEETLTGIGTSGGESVVLLAKGEVFRHYPDLLVLLRDDTTGVTGMPVFGGTIAGGTRFFAFDVDEAADVMDGGWTVIFAEQPTQPRFGPHPGTTIATTNAAHFAGDAYRTPFEYEFEVVHLLGEGDA